MGAEKRKPKFAQYYQALLVGGPVVFQKDLRQTLADRCGVFVKYMWHASDENPIPIDRRIRPKDIDLIIQISDQHIKKSEQAALTEQVKRDNHGPFPIFTTQKIADVISKLEQFGYHNAFPFDLREALGEKAPEAKPEAEPAPAQEQPKAAPLPSIGKARGTDGELTEAARKMLKAAGAKVREARLRKGLTPKQVEQQCGITASYIIGIENGEHTPALEVCEVVEAIVGLPPTIPRWSSRRNHRIKKFYAEYLAKQKQKQATPAPSSAKPAPDAAPAAAAQAAQAQPKAAGEPSAAPAPATTPPATQAPPTQPAHAWGAGRPFNAPPAPGSPNASSIVAILEREDRMMQTLVEFRRRFFFEYPEVKRLELEPYDLRIIGGPSREPAYKAS